MCNIYKTVCKTRILKHMKAAKHENIQSMLAKKKNLGFQEVQASMKAAVTMRCSPKKVDPTVVETGVKESDVKV